jgi:hypothetical protein
MASEHPLCPGCGWAMIPVRGEPAGCFFCRVGIPGARRPDAAPVPTVPGAESYNEKPPEEDR